MAASPPQTTVSVKEDGPASANGSPGADEPASSNSVREMPQGPGHETCDQASASTAVLDTTVRSDSAAWPEGLDRARSTRGGLNVSSAQDEHGQTGDESLSLERTVASIADMESDGAVDVS